MNEFDKNQALEIFNKLSEKCWTEKDTLFIKNFSSFIGKAVENKNLEELRILNRKLWELLDSFRLQFKKETGRNFFATASELEQKEWTFGFINDLLGYSKDIEIIYNKNKFDRTIFYELDEKMEQILEEIFMYYLI